MGATCLRPQTISTCSSRCRRRQNISLTTATSTHDLCPTRLTTTSSPPLSKPRRRLLYFSCDFSVTVSVEVNIIFICQFQLQLELFISVTISVITFSVNYQRDHFKTVLVQLHWLPIRARVTINITTMVFTTRPTHQLGKRIMK